MLHEHWCFGVDSCKRGRAWLRWPTRPVQRSAAIRRSALRSIVCIQPAIAEHRAAHGHRDTQATAAPVRSTSKNASARAAASARLARSTSRDGIHVKCRVDQAIREAPLVVVPGQHFD